MIPKDNYHTSASVQKSFHLKGWGTSSNISNNGGISRYPRIAVEGNGKIHIAWQDTDPGNDDIHYALLQFPTSLPYFPQDFESVTIPNPPAGWTGTNGWVSENGNKIATANNYMVVSNAATNADLTTPVIDCTKYGTVYLQFDQNFSVTTTGTQTVTVDVSADGGSTWNPAPSSSTGNPVVQMTEKTGNNTSTIRIDISRYASGQSQIIVRWRYNNTGTDSF